MKTYSTAITNYRASGQAFVPKNFLSFWVRDRTTFAEVEYHFWDGDEDVSVQVENQETGSLEYRDYLGGGHIVSVDSIIRSIGTGIRSQNFVLSGTSTDVLDMIQGYNARKATFEWHIGEADENTGLLIDTPVCEFIGFIDTIEQEDGAVDAGSSAPATSLFKVGAVSLLRALTRINASVRSKETGQERSGDDFFLYSDAAETWKIYWGKEAKNHKQSNGGGKGGKTTNTKGFLGGGHT